MIPKRRSWLRLLVLVGMLLFQFACETVSTTDSPPADTAYPTQIPPGTPRPRATDSAAQPDIPGIFRPQTTKSGTPGVACLGTSESGVLCTEKNEWVEYSLRKETLASDSILDSAVCSDGRLVVLYDVGVSIYTDGVWEELPIEEVSSIPYAVACEPGGGLWVTYYRGAGHFNGHRWDTYMAEDDFGKKVSDLVYDVAVAPSGSAWIVAADGVVRFNDGTWTVYQDGQGFDGYQSFQRVTIAPDGRPWVSEHGDVHVFDGENWHAYQNDDLTSPQALTVDSQGRVWVGTANDGVFVLEGVEWRRYTTANSDLSSNRIRAIEVDGNGRVWIATGWGLSILDGSLWRVYRVDNAAMSDNDLTSVSVVDGGPSLPQTHEKSAGTLHGRVVDTGGALLPDITVELCVEELPYTPPSNSTPCSGQPFTRTMQTTAEGEFIFELPPGYYYVAVQYGQTWVNLTNRYGIPRRYFVGEKQATYTGEVMLGATE